jgi:hypothetical protein
VGGLQQRELDAPVRLPREVTGVTAQHELMAGTAGGHRVERPRLPGRAARQATQRFDRRRLPEATAHRRRQRVGVDGCWHAAER